MLSRLILLIGLMSAGSALAKEPPGDAAFCRRYAAAAATAAQDAIALNPTCLDPSKGMHPVRQAHAEWCARTPAQEVDGAATHIMRLASRCTQGALAAPTDYGGFDVAGVNEKFEKPYGVARSWEVRAASSGSTFMYCVAVGKRNGREVRIGFDTTFQEGSGQWQIAVPLSSRKDWQGTFEVDGKGGGNGGGSQIGGTSIPGWTIAWLSAGDIDIMRKGRQAVVGIGKRDFDFSLEGVAAALLKVEECRSRKGSGASAAAAAMPVATRAASEPSRAGGEMAWPDVPGASQSCIGPRKGRWEAGAQLVLRNCRPAEDKVFDRAGGKINVGNGDLCIVEKRGDAALTLGACDDAPIWTWSGSAGKSAPIRNADGGCWSIPKLDNPDAKFPFPVVTASCGKPKRPLGFFFDKN